MGVVIGQRDETVVLVHLGFVHTSDCPLSRMFETATDALAARQCEGAVDVAVRPVERDSAPCCPICLERHVTGYSLIPPRMGAVRVFLGWVLDAVFEKDFLLFL